jgi:hypothetical protein
MDVGSRAMQEPLSRTTRIIPSGAPYSVSYIKQLSDYLATVFLFLLSGVVKSVAKTQGGLYFI